MDVAIVAVGPNQVNPAQLADLAQMSLVDVTADAAIISPTVKRTADGAMRSFPKPEISIPGLRLNGHIQNPPPFSNQTIHDGIFDYFYRSDEKNTKQLLEHLFVGEHQTTEIRKISLKVFQEGLFYLVFRGDIELWDGQVGTFVMMVPQRNGAANQMIAGDYSNLELLHSQYPEIFVKPIAYDSVLQNAEVLLPDTSLNLLVVEWLGDYIEMAADYHTPTRILINPGGRQEDRIGHLQLVGKPETSSVILSRSFVILYKPLHTIYKRRRWIILMRLLLMPVIL